MAIKTYGAINLAEMGIWLIYEAQPHVCIKLKSVFPKIAKTAGVPFAFNNTPENCADLLWFMERYPLKISDENRRALMAGKKKYLSSAAELEAILMPEHSPREVALKDGYQARHYQAQAADFDAVQKRFLLGDEIGLGKTLTSILSFFNTKKLPAIVVVQTHLPKQWKEDGVEKFTNLKAHIIKGTQPYKLPPADVYIIKYSCLAGWSDVYQTGFFKSAVFDEVQELRISGSQKYEAAMRLSENVDYCMGMSATPIYNFGDEIFAVLNLIKPGCLGHWYDFIREWTAQHGSHHKVTDPGALGTYLRDNYLFLRRTRADVGRELPPINKIVQTIGYDSAEVKKAEEIARQLAIKVVSGGFMERGQAARELDAFMRHQTGVAKAREVAAYVRVILESGCPVLLAGWHRDVYEIWAKELEDHKPVFYTGTESPAAKQRAKDDFVSGRADLFIISLRSGIGLDGLQGRCRDVVIGELDWSPQVHNQVIGRVDRDGQQHQVTAHFPVCDFGSDPFIIDLLGLKSSQAHGIVDPLKDVPAQHTDESRIKLMAESFIAKHHNNYENQK